MVREDLEGWLLAIEDFFPLMDRPLTGNYSWSVQFDTGLSNSLFSCLSLRTYSVARSGYL